MDERREGGGEETRGRLAAVATRVEDVPGVLVDVSALLLEDVHGVGASELVDEEERRSGGVRRGVGRVC